MLYIVRHAWAGEHGDPKYSDDSLRPLTESGIKRFRKLVRKLAKRGFNPMHVATSPYVRCRQTAEIIAELVPAQPNVTELDALKPGAQLSQLAPWTTEFLDTDVAWVGHAPDVGRLMGELMAAPAQAVDFPKAGVAALELDGKVAAGSGILSWFARPELMRV